MVQWNLIVFISKGVKFDVVSKFPISLKTTFSNKWSSLEHKKFEMRVHLKGHLIMWYDFDRGVRYKTTPITTSKTLLPLKFFLFYLYFTHNFYEIQEIFYLIRLTRRHLTTNAISLNFVQWKYDKNVCIFLCIFNEANITQTGRLYYSFQSVNAKERNIFSVITRHCLWSKITFSCQLLNFLFFLGFGTNRSQYPIWNDKK